MGAMPWVTHQGWDGDGYTEPETWSVQDITFYKSRFEEKLRHNEELRQQVSERTKKLEATNQALKDCSSALSHDLRSPLRHVSSFAELLLEDLHLGRSDSAIKHAERIVAGAKKMQDLIEAMLSFSKMGSASLKITPFNLGEMIREIAISLEGESPEKCINWCISTDLPIVQGDPILMREVWINLLTNSLKYSRYRPIIEVEVGWHATKDGWIIFVRDNGVGFDSQRAEKLFGMFERMHNNPKFEGLGIGLALVRQIVESHGGRIWAESELNKGATFSVFLPSGHISLS